jgi:hypothetical protein
LAFLGMAAVIVLGVLSGGLKTTVGIGSACAASVALVALVVGFIGSREERRVQSEWYDRLLEDLDDETVCIADLKIVQDNAETGKDRGAVWFSNGGLYFAGRRCSFVVGGQDLAEQEVTEDADSVDGLPLRHPSRSVTLKFTPKDGETQIRTRAKYAFFRNLAKFDRTHPECAEPRQYPPLELDPAAKSMVLDRFPFLPLLLPPWCFALLMMSLMRGKDPNWFLHALTLPVAILFGLTGWQEALNRQRVVRRIEAEKLDQTSRVDQRASR